MSGWYRAVLLALTVCLLVLAPALRAAEVVCHASADYFVIERETGAVGRDFLIKPRRVVHAIPACFYAAAPADFEIRNEGAEYSIHAFPLRMRKLTTRRRMHVISSLI